MYALVLLPQWDCATCKPGQKRERGCTDKPIVPQMIDGEELTRCPLRPTLDYRASFERFLKIYSWYKKGHFPDTGSYLDQTAAALQLIEIFDAATAEAEKVKEQRTKARKPGA